MNNSVRVASLILRASALAARFLLFFVMAFYLQPKDVGLYGLISATVSYAALMVGIDFYQYANRELRQAPDSEKFFIVSSSIKIYLCVYFLAIPFIYLVFSYGLLPWSYFVYFFIILVLEHLGQEAYRILIMLGRNLLAGWILFLRLGFWAIAVTILMVLFPSFRSIDVLLLAWCLGALASLCFAIKPILLLRHTAKAHTMEKNWVRKGLKVALPLLAGTLCLRATVTFDRYFMEILNSREVLGAYVFFSGMAATLPAILEAGVFSFNGPKLISAAKNSTKAEYKKIVRTVLRETLFISIAFSILIVFLIKFASFYIPKKLYIENINLLYACIFSQAIMSISMVYHFAIYSKRKDGHIISSHAIGLFIFLITIRIIGSHYNLMAVPFSLILCNLSILIYKYSVYAKSG